MSYQLDKMKKEQRENERDRQEKATVERDEKFQKEQQDQAKATEKFQKTQQKLAKAQLAVAAQHAQTATEQLAVSKEQVGVSMESLEVSKQHIDVSKQHLDVSIDIKEDISKIVDAVKDQARVFEEMRSFWNHLSWLTGESEESKWNYILEQLNPGKLEVAVQKSAVLKIKESWKTDSRFEESHASFRRVNALAQQEEQTRHNVENAKGKCEGVARLFRKAKNKRNVVGLVGAISAAVGFFVPLVWGLTLLILLGLGIPTVLAVSKQSKALKAAEEAIETSNAELQRIKRERQKEFEMGVGLFRQLVDVLCSDRNCHLSDEEVKKFVLSRTSKWQQNVPGRCRLQQPEKFKPLIVYSERLNNAASENLQSYLSRSAEEVWAELEA